MAKGFFKSSSLVLNKRQTTIPQCGACKLYENCKSPKMAPGGRGEIKILHVAEAGGPEEDRKNDQLVGKTGRFYTKILKSLGLELNACLKTNTVICPIPSTETPSDKQIDACRPNLVKTIKEFKPHVIIALGKASLTALIGHLFDKKLGGITKWNSEIIPSKEFNCWICPVFHPSYVMRDSSPEIAEKIFRDDLQRAIKIFDVDLPHCIKDDESKNIELLKHPRDVINWLKDLNRKECLVAFDYETTGLKPTKNEHRIVSCAISCGPFHSVTFKMFDDLKFIQTFKDFLQAENIKKIVANLIFEANWSSVILDSEVNGFFFDTTIGSHVIDNREGITSLEHQIYCKCGIPPYDYKIKPFLKPKGSTGNEQNKVDECSLEDLLIYNGLDSLSEFRLGLIQMEKLGINYQKYYRGAGGKELAPQLFR